MACSFPLPAGRLGRGDSRIRDRVHLVNRTEQGGFIDVAHALRTEGVHRVPVFPQGDRGPYQRAVGDFEIVVTHRIQHIDPAQVAGITAHQKGPRPLPPRQESP